MENFMEFGVYTCPHGIPVGKLKTAADRVAKTAQGPDYCEHQFSSIDGRCNRCYIHRSKIPKVPSATNTAHGRDELAEECCDDYEALVAKNHERGACGTGLPDPVYFGYQAGWDARDEEVKRLKADIEHCAQVVNDGGYGKLDAENKRLKERTAGVLEDNYAQACLIKQLREALVFYANLKDGQRVYPGLRSRAADALKVAGQE